MQFARVEVVGVRLTELPGERGCAVVVAVVKQSLRAFESRTIGSVFNRELRRRFGAYFRTNRPQSDNEDDQRNSTRSGWCDEPAGGVHMTGYPYAGRAAVPNGTRASIQPG